LVGGIPQAGFVGRVISGDGVLLRQDHVEIVIRMAAAVAEVRQLLLGGGVAVVGGGGRRRVAGNSGGLRGGGLRIGDGFLICRDF